MTISERDERPILGEGLVKVFQAVQPVVRHTLGARKFALAGLIKQTQTFTAV